MARKKLLICWHPGADGSGWTGVGGSKRGSPWPGYYALRQAQFTLIRYSRQAAFIDLQSILMPLIGLTLTFLRG